MKNFLIITTAAMLGFSYLIISAPVATNSSGGGEITTDNTQEGSIMSLEGLATQAVSAITSTPQENPSVLSGYGLAALQRREGFSAKPYPDHKGFSIGYGHLIKAGENLTLLSVSEALEILAADVLWAQDAVMQGVTAVINQNQFDALVSFCFNVGAGAFSRSTLVKRINADDPQASNEFARWVYASGQINQSLMARRESEAQQFESGAA
jgi:GH24 family phage-related lysozyme (muramidase)